MKGVSLLALAILMLFAALGMQLLLITYGIGEGEVMRRTYRELAVLKALNSLELLKQVLADALTFSLQEAYALVGQRGGYADLQGIKAHECIAYWRIYNNILAPSWERVEGEVVKHALEEFNWRAQRVAGKFEVPRYSELRLEVEEASVGAMQPIALHAERLHLQQNANFSMDSKLLLRQAHELAYKNFIEQDKLLEALEQGLQQGYEAILQAIRGLEVELSRSLPTTIQVVELKLEDSKVAVHAKVSIQEEYKIVYGNILKPAQLSFRLITGNAELIEPPSEPC